MWFRAVVKEVVTAEKMDSMQTCGSSSAGNEMNGGTQTGRA